MATTKTTDARPPNPRGDRRGGHRSDPRDQRLFRGVWAVIAVLLLMTIARGLFLEPGGRTVSYSEFKGMVRAGRV